MVNFEKSAATIFNSFEKYYDFKICTSNKHISLINELVSIDIYFEDYFEVNTYIKFTDINKKDINLISLSRHLNLDKNTKSFILHNQIANNRYLIKYLQCVRSVLLVIIDLFEKDRTLFNKCLNNYYQDNLEYNEEKQIHAILSLLNTLWHDKKYDDYLLYFQKNNKLITKNKNFLLAHRRTSYIKKHIS